MAHRRVVARVESRVRDTALWLTKAWSCVSHGRVVARVWTCGLCWVPVWSYYSRISYRVARVISFDVGPAVGSVIANQTLKLCDLIRLIFCSGYDFVMYV